MTKASAQKLPPLQAGLVTALAAIDNQIARDLQRSPEKLEQAGVQKWAIYERKIEEVTKLLLDELENQTVELDGLIVLLSAMAKSLQLLIEDLGPAGLGNLRTQYCLKVLNDIAEWARRGELVLDPKHDLN